MVMAYYIGIDLGTTNSSIVTFDGEKTRVWKTKEQTDVTPSYIFVDKKGRRFIGNKAYKAQGKGENEKRIAKQFKRFMGTGTKIELAGELLTPEECSAEVLKELLRCLPEDIVQADDRYTVITVPAVFDQMQNEATKKAAKMANIGHVAVMQEPVAAIMSVMHNTDIRNGSFIIFDMGGGTLDVAIASCINGKVDIVAHGGVAMCGGVDIDRRIVDNIIKPWLLNNDDYVIPDDFMSREKYQKLLQRSRFYAEEAKIELSSEESADIYGLLGRDITDENGEEIELDITVTRDEVDSFIADLVQEAVECARDTIKKSGIPLTDFERIVFIGGPCNYKPLRDKVSKELGIKNYGLDVNPMTAVAEGAAIFAESIDWTSIEHERKASNKVITSEELGISFKYEARTMKENARFQVKTKADTTGYTIEVRSVDTGWTSGLLDLKNGTLFSLPLIKKGSNTFEVHVYDTLSREVKLEENKITIVQTMSTIGSILASHTISVEVKEGTLSKSATLDTLVREGDKLPTKGSRKYKATERIKAGDPNGALRLKLWEGDITTSITDNKFIGMIKIEGTDLDYGAIRPGDEIEFNYTINEAGSLDVEVSIERLGIVKNEKNFYDSTAAEKDMRSEDTVYELEDEGDSIIKRIEALEKEVSDTRLDKVRSLAEEAQLLADDPMIDPEKVKKTSDNLLKAKALLEEVRLANQEVIRAEEIKSVQNWYKNEIESYCSDVEKEEMSNMIGNLERLSHNKSHQFDMLISDIYGYGVWKILFRKSQTFVESVFADLRRKPFSFTNQETYRNLITRGEQAIEDDNFNELQQVVMMLFKAQKKTVNVGDMMTAVNIMKG